MNRWGLIDIDDNIYIFTDDAFKILNRSFEVDIDVIERSFRAGADFPGIQRDKSTVLEFKHDYNNPSEQEFRRKTNELIMKLRDVVKVRDLINNIETDCLMEKLELTYDEGGFNKGSVKNPSFIQLNPFWEDVDYTIIEESRIIARNTGGIAEDIIKFFVGGYFDPAPIITLTALEACNKFFIQLLETGEGILIRDSQFGISGLNTYIIDSKEGIVELNQVNRMQKVKLGTGPFNLKKQAYNNLFIQATGELSINIKFKKRSYI